MSVYDYALISALYDILPAVLESAKLVSVLRRTLLKQEV